MGVRQYALAVREAAEALGVSGWLIREECRTGRLFSIKVRGRIVIPVWALEEYIGTPLAQRTKMPQDSGDC